jgi:hypothetical protein
MLKGTRIIQDNDVIKYNEIINTFRGLLHL